MRALRIGLVGDRSPAVKAHTAIPRALAFAAEKSGCAAEGVWFATGDLSDASRLSGCDAVWCVPGSPYQSMEGALAAIRFARERPLPFLGTCGGFQHALIELARDVLGYAQADHEESSPHAAMPLVSRLACSLVGQEGAIFFTPGSKVAAIYGPLEAVERYHCNFGVNAAYRAIWEKSAVSFTGFDANGEPRVLELGGHPFFLGTLFQPELSALEGRAHPIVEALLRASMLRS
jgi:CTP synthase (UTP-ammonia lyase)